MTEDLESIVREYFLAEEGDRRVALSAGALRRLNELVRDAASHETRRATPVRRDLAVATWHVEHVDEQHAVVRCDATLTTARHGEPPTHRRIDRVELERANDGWRVRDYVADGVRRTDDLTFDPGGRQTSNGVTVEVLALARHPEFTELVLRIANDGSKTLDLFDVATSDDRSSWTRLRAVSPNEVPPRATRLVHAVAAPGVGLSTRIAIAAAAGRIVPFEFDLGAAGEPPPERLPRPFRRRGYVANGVAAAAAAAIVVTWYLGRLRDTGLVLVLVAAGIGLLFRRQRDAYPQRVRRRIPLIAIATAVVGIALVAFAR